MALVFLSGSLSVWRTSTAFVYLHLPLTGNIERSCENHYTDSEIGNLWNEKACETRGLTSVSPQHLPASGVLVLVYPSTTPVFTVSAIPVCVTIIFGGLACTTSPS